MLPVVSNKQPQIKKIFYSFVDQSVDPVQVSVPPANQSATKPCSLGKIFYLHVHVPLHDVGVPADVQVSPILAVE